MVGKVFSHYKILEHLGGGGMGVVYKAEDTRLRRTVALKFLPPEFTRDAEAKARFIHEAQAASALDHPNICDIHDIGETPDGQLFIVMTCYEGETLKKKIERRPLKVEDAIDFALQVAQGLTKAHEHGIIHRDIKPANIMVTSDGVAKIVDFGLAKLSGRTMLTKTGSTLGTAAYMSPEQTRGESIDHRSDIWSLGVMLYEMVTGQAPFRGDYENAVVYSILNTRPEPMTGIRTGVPMELERIVGKAMSKDPSERYQHVDEMLVDLKHLRKESESAAHVIMAPAVSAKRPRWKKLLLPAAIVLGLLVVIFVLIPNPFDEVLVSEPKPIAVVTFVNQTGDRGLDYLAEAIPNLLITSLEQSRYLRVMTWERMRDLLTQMGRKDVAVIDKEIGFELCQREGVHAIVTGTFTRAGETFMTDVKVLDVDTKELLETASARGEGVGSILNTQIDQLSREISRGVGLSQRKIGSSPSQIAEVTTSSMDAYNYFLRGRDEYDRFHFKSAREFLERAVGLDSTFAMAYLYLAQSYSSLTDWNAEAKAIQRAKALSSRAPEKERLWIEARYAASRHAGIDRNREKEQAVLEELVAKFPREKRLHNALGFYYQYWKQPREAQREFEEAIRLDPNYAAAVNTLAYVYVDQGDYHRAIEAFQRYASLSPGDANPFDSMGELYLVMGRLDESIARYSEALRVEPTFRNAYVGLAYVYALKEEYDVSLRWLDSLLAAAAPTPGIRAAANYRKLSYLKALGRLREARRTLEVAERLLDEMGDRRAYAFVYYSEAFRALGEANLDAARRHMLAFFEAFRALQPQTPLYNAVQQNTLLGFLELTAGRIDSAQGHIAEAKKGIDSVETLNPSLPMMLALLEAELLLAEGLPDSAIHVYRRAPVAPPRMSDWRMVLYNTPPLRDVTPRAFQAKGQPDSAIVEYARLLRIDTASQDRRYIDPRFHYRLAKLFELTRKSEPAAAEYRRFLEIWKNADPDRPEFIDARKRLAALKVPK